MFYPFSNTVLSVGVKGQYPRVAGANVSIASASGFNCIPEEAKQRKSVWYLAVYTFFLEVIIINRLLNLLLCQMDLTENIFLQKQIKANWQLIERLPTNTIVSFLVFSPHCLQIVMEKLTGRKILS